MESREDGCHRGGGRRGEEARQERRGGSFASVAALALCVSGSLSYCNVVQGRKRGSQATSSNVACSSMIPFFHYVTFLSPSPISSISFMSNFMYEIDLVAPMI
jgi:hypothetical protein